jgi:hypothetical protein
MRKFAYRRYSKGRAARWLILLTAGRAMQLRGHLRSLASTRPDNLITETGREFDRHGIDSRIGKRRADVVRQTLDSVIVAGPGL